MERAFKSGNIAQVQLSIASHRRGWDVVKMAATHFQEGRDEPIMSLIFDTFIGSENEFTAYAIATNNNAALRAVLSNQHKHAPSFSKSHGGQLLVAIVARGDVQLLETIEKHCHENARLATIPQCIHNLLSLSWHPSMTDALIGRGFTWSGSISVHYSYPYPWTLPGIDLSPPIETWKQSWYDNARILIQHSTVEWKNSSAISIVNLLYTTCIKQTTGTNHEDLTESRRKLIRWMLRRLGPGGGPVEIARVRLAFAAKVMRHKPRYYLPLLEYTRSELRNHCARKNCPFYGARKCKDCDANARFCSRPCQIKAWKSGQHQDHNYGST